MVVFSFFLIEEKRYALLRYLIVIVLVKHNEKSSLHASLVTRWTFKQNFISLATASLFCICVNFCIHCLNSNHHLFEWLKENFFVSTAIVIEKL